MMKTFSITKRTTALVLAMLMIITFIPFASVSMTADAASRATVVKYMRSMATIKWSSSKNITYWNYVNDKSEKRKFKAGVTYTGMPYTQLNRKNLNQFQSQLSGTKYIGPTKYSSYYGNDCSWSVRCSWDQLGKGVSFSYTGNMFPGSGTGVRAVGSYKSSASTSSTKTITTKSGKSTMYAAYAQLKPGDAIMARHTPSKINHTRLVVSVSGSGENGKVKVIEQCGLSASRGNTTWNVDKTYTFKQLYSTYYIPITSDALKGAKTDDAPPTGPSQLKISKYNTPPTNLGLGKSFSIYGTITSNYTIKSVTVGIYNKNGVAVSEHKATPNSTSFSISTIDKYVKFAMAKAGKNTYRIKATDEKETKKLVEKSYTVGGSGNGNSSAEVSKLSIKDYSYPTSIQQGSSYPITGTVTSNYKLKSITVGIYNANGKAVSTKTVKPNAKSYSIAKLKSYVKFENANKGVNHYKVKATDEKQTKTLLDKKFNVAGSANKPNKEAEKSTLKLESYKYPIKLNFGQSFRIKGDITSNYKITSVTVGIYDANGTEISAKTVNPKSRTYSIESIENFIKFKNAPVGKNYYKISATDEKSTKELLNVSFTVKQTDPASKLTLKNANYPTVLTKGKAFTIKGTASSNYNIKKITVGIYETNGEKIVAKTVKPDKMSYSLDEFNKHIKFEDLKAGTYKYKVVLTDEIKKAVPFIDQTFTVKPKNDSSSSLTTKYFGIMGDSTMFLYTKDNKTTSIIIDTGNSDATAAKSSEKSFIDKLNANQSSLKKKGGKYVIDYLFITHGHTDHLDGLYYDMLGAKKDVDSAKSKYHINHLIVNGLVKNSDYLDDDSKGFNKFIKKAVNKKLIDEVTYVIPHSSSKTIKLKDINGDAVNITGKWSYYSNEKGTFNAFATYKIASDFKVTIFPAIDEYKTGDEDENNGVSGDDQNNSSMLLKFEYTKNGSKTNYVFLGDIFEDALDDICNEKKDSTYRDCLATTETTYLKINHHASRRVALSTFGNSGLKKYMADNNLYVKSLRVDKSNGLKKSSVKKKAQAEAAKISPKGYNYCFYLKDKGTEGKEQKGYFYIYTESQAHKAFNDIKQWAVNDDGDYKVTYKYDNNGTIKTKEMEFTNYDEKIKSYFATNKSGGAKLIGIGNIKTRNGRMAADTTTFFAIEGCDEYIDLRNAFKNLDIPSQCTVKAISYLNDTYTVKQ